MTTYPDNYSLHDNRIICICEILHITVSVEEHYQLSITKVPNM